MAKPWDRIKARVEAVEVAQAEASAEAAAVVEQLARVAETEEGLTDPPWTDQVEATEEGNQETITAALA